MEDIPTNIQALAAKRRQLRTEGQFAQADAIREELLSQGYRLFDEKDQTRIEKMGDQKAKNPRSHYLVLFGSGEIAPSATKVHETVFRQLGLDHIHIAIVSTPAGFQPNVSVVHEEIARYFQTSLQNYHPEISIIYANTATLANSDSIIAPLSNADYIFVGPGSPTYAVKHLKDTLLLQTIIDKVKNGISLAISSAAELAFSQYCLPVYEIYKAGADPVWQPGLDVYSQLYRELTVIPHYDNREGGEKNDTSHCFMGKERFNNLLQKLPKGKTLWGLDEHTSVIIDLKTRELQTIGKGQLHQISY